MAGKRDALRGYRAKRDFERTPEPGPRAAQAAGGWSGNPRFVIHEHHARRLHWDLRLERDGVLASWAVPKGMPEAPGENRFAAHTEDHPIEYLDFEGEIPAGQYGAGKMLVWDRGTYECLKWEPRKVEVRLHGERLDARYALFPIEQGERPKDWMVHRMDPASDPAREPMPSRIVPMLARAGELPADERGWAFEVKWDGVRAILYSEPGELRLESRNLNDITRSYPELRALGDALGSHAAVLDGEIVAFDADGRPSFERLQARMHLTAKAQVARQAKESPVTYMAFDLLWLDGRSLIALPYEQRRARLAELELDGPRWQTPEHVVGHGAALLAATAEQGLEGVLAKRLDSTYEPGRRARGWVKVKTVARQELVVGGWLPGKGKRLDGIGALLVGVYEDDGKLRYVGRVGTGFSDRELARLAKLLAPLARERSPFEHGTRPPRESRFCEPELVAEVEFNSWTAGGNLRAPSYKGLREDKDPREVVREPVSAAPRQAGGEASPIAIPAKGESAVLEVEGRELRFSNLGKTIYPKARFAKRDLISYYAAIAPVLLPHLQGRALTVTRWPDGVEGKSFFQKQTPSHKPDWVRTARVEHSSKPVDYTLADDLPTLLWLANLAAIELHAPLARAARRQRPTTLVFDLDPGPPAGIRECCRVALQLQGMFENLGLRCYAKTSGSKGMQVYLPLNDDGVTFEQTKPFALTVAQLLEEAEGELVVSRMTKSKRTGKVLIDWSQNDIRKTTVCVYSLRASERPWVSTPLEWEEVREGLEAGRRARLQFDWKAVLKRVEERGDVFAPVLSEVQKLPSF